VVNSINSVFKWTVCKSQYCLEMKYKEYSVGCELMLKQHKKMKCSKKNSVYTSHKAMQVCVITALSQKIQKKKMLVCIYSRYHQVDINNKVVWYQHVLWAVIENLQRAYNSITRHKGFRKYQCTKKSYVVTVHIFRMGRYIKRLGLYRI
jgi:hypothetical protein